MSFGIDIRLFKRRASYEPLDVIVRASLPGRMADSAITSPKVRLLRNPTEPLTPWSVRLADPFRPRPNVRAGFIPAVEKARIAADCSTLSNSGGCQLRNSFYGPIHTTFGRATWMWMRLRPAPWTGCRRQCASNPVSYTHLRAHETRHDLV